MSVACPNCGNARSLLVKTLQGHVLHVEGIRVKPARAFDPAVFEVLCDECETALDFDKFDETIRREILLTLGAR
jgi:hypothetical protein